jgi:hypothetical protein
MPARPRKTTGIEFIDTGIGYSPAEVEAILAKEFGL